MWHILGMPFEMRAYTDARVAVEDYRPASAPGDLRVSSPQAAKQMREGATEVDGILDAYIRWYNEARIKVSLGARSPIEHRRSLGIPV